jgi:hypothetical protein
MFDAFLDRLMGEHVQTQAAIQRLASEHQAEVNNLLRLEGAIGTARKMIAMAKIESPAPPGEAPSPPTGAESASPSPNP